MAVDTGSVIMTHPQTSTPSFDKHYANVLVCIAHVWPLMC